MPYLVSWNLIEKSEGELPFGLSMAVELPSSWTIPSSMKRAEWANIALQTGNIHEDWDVADGYFMWWFKTESARTFFLLATSGEGENEKGVEIRMF